MTLSAHPYRYSMDSDVTIGQLKQGEQPHDTDISAIQSWMDQHRIVGIAEGMAQYHYKFLLIKQKPYIVYYTGNYDLLSQPILAIVGPRKMSSYAEQVVDHLFSLLPSYQLVTISGLADGVDQRAHLLSIEKGIPTIAVLGAGLGYYLQSANRHLLHQIIDAGGLVISEFKLKQKPKPYTYPQRNRIIAGLADAIFIPEAAEKSGSLITADFAIDMQKPIYGTPNHIFASSHDGLHQYIADKKITFVHDMIPMLDIHFSRRDDHTFAVPTDISDEQKMVLSFIADMQSVSLEQLVNHMKQPLSELLPLVTALEMDGYIYQSTPGRYILSRTSGG